MATLAPVSVAKTRTPKLTYRTKSDDATSFQTSRTDETHTTTSPSQPPWPPTTDSSPFPSPGQELSESESQPQSRRPSFALPPTMVEQRETATKKKPSFFASLFTAREPSARALAQYQKQLKEAATGGRRSAPARMPGISRAKLPPTVPKVNSKWDGIPESKRQMQKKSSNASQNSRSALDDCAKSDAPGYSESSTESRGLRKPKSRDALGGMSTHSGGGQNRLATLYGWESADGSREQLNQDGAADIPRSTIPRSESN